MTDTKEYSDGDWKNETRLGNECFSIKNYGKAHQHYKEAQALAKQLFTKFRGAEPLPSGLTPVLVISYLNLSEYWAEQGSRHEQKDCLLEVYNLLVTLLKTNNVSDALYKQVCQGLTKVYVDLCRYFKNNNELFALAKTRAEYLALVSTGQTQTIIEELTH